MILRFYAREGHVLRPPGQRSVGTILGAVGRDRKKTERGIEMAASELPTEVESTSPFGKRIRRLFQQTPNDPPLWAADEQTAAFCGVPYVPLKRTEYGEFAPVALAPATQAKIQHSTRKAGDA